MLIAPSIAALTAFLLTLWTVPWVRRWALRTMVDVPNERSSHEVPTPRGGGLPIMLIAGVVSLVATSLGSLRGGPTLGLVLFAVGGVGLMDDARGLGPGVRFAAQFAAAGALVLFASAYDDITLPFVGTVALPDWVGILSTIVWVVGLTNAYNFMDGIDGLAGVQGVVAAAGWGIVAYVDGAFSVVLLAAALAGSTVGFLRYNWHPAQIFMGDVASTSLGLVFAALPLVYPASTDSASAARLPLLAVGLVGPFVIDATFTFFRRAMRRENVLRPHRSHVYQRLVITGLSHASVASLYLLACLSSAVGSMLWFYEMVSGWVPLAALLGPFLALWLAVIRREAAART